MIYSVLFLCIGILLLILLRDFGRGRSSDSVGASSGAPDPLGYSVRLPPRALLARCIAVDDVAFAVSLRSPRVLRLLRRERRHLVMQWLWLTKREAGRLFGLHVRAVRHAADLRPIAEIKLIAQLGLFFLIYEILGGLVWFYGPFRMRGYVGSIDRLAGILSSLGDRIGESVGAEPASTVQAAHGE